jgi:hypothetical protein
MPRGSREGTIVIAIGAHGTRRRGKHAVYRPAALRPGLRPSRPDHAAAAASLRILAQKDTHAPLGRRPGHSLRYARSDSRRARIRIPWPDRQVPRKIVTVPGTRHAASDTEHSRGHVPLGTTTPIAWPFQGESFDAFSCDDGGSSLSASSQLAYADGSLRRSVFHDDRLGRGQRSHRGLSALLRFSGWSAWSPIAANGPPADGMASSRPVHQRNLL